MVEEKKIKVEEKKEVNTEAVETKVAPKSVPAGPDKEKKEEKKVVKVKEVPKKDVAVANGFSLKISPKQSKYVCRLLRGKTPEGAIARLQAVIDEKRPVPMAGLEVGHKKGKGLACGKFPKNACRGIMEIVKQAGANAVVAGIESPVITIARADRASAPFRRAGRKAKRTHLLIEVRDKKWLVENKSKKGKKK